MSSHRNSVIVPIKLADHPELRQCLDDKAYRVMVFCAGDANGTQDISFPHQSELKVNGGEVKANLRGLKKKPGSTRPVDITSHLRLLPNYTNNVELIYALTTKVRRAHNPEWLDETMSHTVNSPPVPSFYFGFCVRPRELASTNHLLWKPYYLAIYLCKTVRTDDLVVRIRNGQKISKTTTLRECESQDFAGPHCHLHF